MKVDKAAIYEASKKLSNWGRWGKDDQIGTLNNVTPQDVIDAGRLIKRGKVFSLGLSLKEPIQSGLFGGRWNPIHTMLATGTDCCGDAGRTFSLSPLRRRRDQHAMSGVYPMGRALPCLPRRQDVQRVRRAARRCEGREEAGQRACSR